MTSFFNSELRRDNSKLDNIKFDSNHFVQDLSSNAFVKIRSFKIFRLKSFVIPVLTYGSEIWDFEAYLINITASNPCYLGSNNLQKYCYQPYG